MGEGSVDPNPSDWGCERGKRGLCQENLSGQMDLFASWGVVWAWSHVWEKLGRTAVQGQQDSECMALQALVSEEKS